MSLPDQTPKLPKLPFLIGDAALLVTGWYIAYQSDGPLSLAGTAVVAGCVIAGAIIGAIPFLTDYARKQDEALDERQRSLDALSRTVTGAAEQIGIAATGFHQIAEIAHKTLKQAEQLPHRLQDKIAEFNAQIENAREDEREELEKEIAELRASESERLETSAEKINKTVAELARLDAAAQKQIAARTEALERATQAVTKAQSDSSAAVREAISAALRDLAEAQNQALAAIDRKLAERTAAAVAAIEASLAKASTAVAPSITTAPSTAPEAFAAPSEDVAPPVKRPRKSRREEPEVATETASEPPPEAPPAEPLVAVADVEPSDPAPSTPSEPPAEAAEPAPVVAESISHIAPIAPASADPFGLAPATVTEAEVAHPVAEPAPAAAIEGEPVMAATAVEPPPTERPGRKRAKAAPVDPTPDLFSQSSPDEFALAGDESPVTAGEAVESVMSSDGATRLIATAYIGIGNRLFIRGDGPGLSWDKGLPLQFISIGKWRWETSDPAGPIRFKLLKNDETESSLGSLTLEPGHQQEVTVKF